ncbi:MAG TPA: ATP-binding protein [Kiritimatiellia bacterium]|nr:ATP-binding protein [Kiritimatiellia bacterium]
MSGFVSSWPHKEKSGHKSGHYVRILPSYVIYLAKMPRFTCGSDQKPAIPPFSKPEWQIVGTVTSAIKDRLEVWNPGSLPPPLTPESLRGPHASIPHNPLLAEPMYLTKYIERMGTGIRDMIRRCVKAGLPEPEIRMDGGSFVLTIRRQAAKSGARSGPSRDQITPPVDPPVTPPVAVVVLVRLLGSTGPLGNSEVLARLGLSDRTHLREHYIDPALADGLVERTIPAKPTSRFQKYRLTDMGRALLAQLEKGEKAE